MFTDEEVKRAQLCPIELHIPCKHCFMGKYKFCPGRGMSQEDFNRIKAGRMSEEEKREAKESIEGGVICRP